MMNVRGLTMVACALSVAWAGDSWSGDKEWVGGQHAQIGGEKEVVSIHPQHPDAQWFPDAGLGLFLHWGISSVRAMNISWPMIPGRPLANVRVDNPTERERIIREMDYNLNGKGVEITPNEYWRLATDFNPQNYHPEVWLKKAKEAGFTYVVLTAKHHDGFALWPSAYGTFNTKNYAGGKDLIRPYIEACRKLGLKVGIYFSGPDWYYDQSYMNFLYYKAARKNPEFNLGPDLKPRTEFLSKDALENHQKAYADLVRGQIEELLTRYGKIDLIWFDGKPGIPNGKNVISQERIRALQPGILINGRMHGKGDFLTYERHLPERQPKTTQWAEFCNPWNGAWPYVDRTYRCPGYVLAEFVKCRAWGMNYLLGIGPMATGDLAPAAYENMELLGAWTARNKAALYDVRPLPKGEKASVLASAKEHYRFLYLTREFEVRDGRVRTSERDMLPLKEDVFTISGLDARVKKVIYMPTGKPLKYRLVDGTLSVKVPISERSNLVDVVCILLKK